MDRFSLGQAVFVREFWAGRLWTLRPMRVVIDGPSAILLDMQPGTVWQHPYTVDGGPVPHFLPDQWILRDRV